MKLIKVSLKLISNVLVAAVVVLAFLLHGFQIFGIQPLKVLSGSMESVYPTGSVIYVAKVDPAKLEVNDVITYKLKSGTLATHRIIEKVADEDDPEVIRFRTKGDENDIADKVPVDYDSVVGKPLFCIPQLGYLAAYIASPNGKIVAISVAISIVLFEIIVSIAFDDKGKNKSEKNK